MSKNYLSYKALKKNFAVKLIIFLIVLAVIFTIALVRLALSSAIKEAVNNPPKNEDAYAIAKEFIKPGIKSGTIHFPETGYQCAQKPDSIYVIKAYVESKNQSGEKNVVSFEITMHFNGGDARDKKSWKLLNLVEN